MHAGITVHLQEINIIKNYRCTIIHTMEATAAVAVS